MTASGVDGAGCGVDCDEGYGVGWHVEQGCAAERGSGASDFETGNGQGFGEPATHDVAAVSDALASLGAAATGACGETLVAVHANATSCGRQQANGISSASLGFSWRLLRRSRRAQCLAV